MAQVALLNHRRGERGEGQLETIDASVSTMHQQLHSDLQDAIATIEASDDPKVVSEAIAAAVKSVLGGVGSGKTTTDLIGKLKEELKAAEAANNAPLAAQIKAAIAQLEPFAKGRQWQSEQLAKAQAVVDSNKSTADKVAALKGIQSDLLSHQRTMAAGIISKQIDTVQAIDKLSNRLKNALGGILFSGRAPGKEEDDRTQPPKPRSPQVNDATGFKLASGMPFVPSDNFPASLHRGEAVLTADQADDWRGGGNTTYNVPIQGLIRAESPFQIAEQLKRLGDFGVLTPRRKPA